MILGNDDRKVIKKILENAEGILHINEKIFENEGYEFVGFSFVPITPFKTSFELKEEDIHIKIENLVKKLKNPSKSIWVFHAPPKDTGLDICLKLDENLRPVYEDNEPVFHSVGSISVRNAIEKYQPFLYLCGHIHESPGIRKIGKTLCINPGSEHEKGILRLAFIDTEKREVEIWSL
jgi:Icc-related predicted phosphoesterase